MKKDTPTALKEIEGLELLGETADCRVYFLCDGDTVVYVGQTTNLAVRLSSHNNDKTFDRVFFVRCSSEEMGPLETKWIKALRPKYNISKTGPAFWTRPKKGAHKRIKHRERMALFLRARSELEVELGIGKNAPDPEAILARMQELAAADGWLLPPAGAV
jgi:hypothetical protein